jgi:hypothetical protein
LGQQETRCKRQRHILDHPRTLNSGKIGVSLILAERGTPQDVDPA